jgi:hypothetical protein
MHFLVLVRVAALVLGFGPSVLVGVGGWTEAVMLFLSVDALR